MKIAHFVPIGKQTWPSEAILISDWGELKKNDRAHTLNPRAKI